MVDMGAIKGLQSTFHDIGRANVSIEKGASRGVAFGRNVTSPAQGARGASAFETNKAIMGSVLGQLKGAGANMRLMKFAEATLNTLDQSKPLTGRAVERAMGQIKKTAVMLTKQEVSLLKSMDGKPQKLFNAQFPAVLKQLSQAQGHDTMPVNKQGMKIMQDAFTKLCQQCVKDTGMPPQKGQLQAFMKDIAQSFTNRDTTKTICNACTVLRTRLEGGQSPSEMAFHEKAAERGMNIPLDNNARNLLNVMWRAECEDTFMGGQAHKPGEGELEKVMDKVLDKFFNRAALSFAGPQIQPHSASSGLSHGPTAASQEKKAHGDKDTSTVHADTKVQDIASTVPEAQTDIKADTKEDTKATSGAKAETKAETKPQDDVKSESKGEAKTEIKTETKPETKPQDEVKGEPNTAPKPEAEAEPASTPDAKPVADTKPTSDSKPADTVKPEIKATKPMDPGLAKVIQATKELEDLQELLLAEALEELEQEVDLEDLGTSLSYDIFNSMQELQDREDELRQSLDAATKSMDAFLHSMDRK